jgi:hypothetical protein
MAAKKRNPKKKKSRGGKPGSDPQAAKSFGGEGDFGAAVDRPRTADRDYVSANTKAADPGAAHPRAGEIDGVRTSGAGAPATGPGSGSGGDLDTDIIGVGTGGSGIATSGVIGRPPAPDDSDGTSGEFASGGPAEGRNQGDVGKIGGSRIVRGSTISRDTDLQSHPSGQGADAATNPSARGDDSFSGEISSGEAQGQDSPLSPSQDDQG